MSQSVHQSAIDQLQAIMARLRDPQQGCPWDLQQDFASIAPHTIEEAYEVADAIAQNDMAALKDELGDLVFQAVFYAQMAQERGWWNFTDVITGLNDKMIRRHPHVFGDAVVADAQAQLHSWEAIKAQERAGKTTTAPPSALDGVAVGLPGLTRAVKLQKRAARVGFDWTEAGDILDKIEEEIGELRAELEARRRDPDRILDEMGDLLFVLANLARRLEVDPETALRGANAKFERRFRRIEFLLAEQGRTADQASLDDMEALWQQAKREERR